MTRHEGNVIGNRAGRQGSCVLTSRGTIAGAAMLVLAGCGSTVPLANGQSGVSTGSGLSARVPSASAQASPASTNAGSLPNGAQSRTHASVNAGATTASAPSGGIGTTAPSGAVVAADRPVAIGVIGYSNSGAALSGLGVSGIDTGDNAAEAKAVVRYLNAHGGLDGHQISIAVHLENTESLIVNDSSEEQAACTDLTRDHHVFAVVSIASTAIGLGCFAHAHVPMISDAIEPTIAQERSDDGYYYGPSDINMDREYQDMVDGLYRGGFFGRNYSAGSVRVIGVAA